MTAERSEFREAINQVNGAMSALGLTKHTISIKNTERIAAIKAMALARFATGTLQQPPKGQAPNW
eukprot:4095899-Amphidinium_carterae.1